MASQQGARRLGVLELSTHENFLADFCSITDGVADVTVFTTPDIHDRIHETVESRDTEVEWILQGENESKSAFLSRVEAWTNGEVDVLWSFPLYGPVPDYLRYARFDPHCPFVLSMYDLNGWLGRNPVFTPKVYNYLKYPLRRLLLRHVDTITVEYEPIEMFVADRLGQVAVETFTPVLYADASETADGTPETADGSDVVCTVPGMIDETRRDYDLLVDALDALAPYVQDAIELVLLGRPVGDYGDRILDQCERLERTGIDVTVFREWITTERFADEVTRSDVLVSPLRRTRYVDGFEEVYGTSKGSGVLGDGIRHATPVALPQWYDVPDQLYPATVQFQNESDLTATLEQLVTEPDRLSELREGAREVASHYTLGAQRERMKAILQTATDG